MSRKEVAHNIVDSAVPNYERLNPAYDMARTITAKPAKIFSFAVFAVNGVTNSVRSGTKK